MKLDEIRSVIIGNVEALDQGISLVESLSDEQYQFIPAPYVKSSIGQHFRHVVDMFFAIVAPQDKEVIDFDYRRRGADIETSRTAALSELNQIKSWMSGFLDSLASRFAELERDICVRTEVCIKETHSVDLQSTTIRELVFTSSHAVHHYALISVIAKLQDVKLDENLGVAPATATFLRAETTASASVKEDVTAESVKEPMVCAQ